MSLKEKLIALSHSEQIVIDLNNTIQMMKMDLFIRDRFTGIITKTNDVLVWSKWFEDPLNRQVLVTNLTYQWWIYPITISTIFLGIPHSFNNKKKPLLWENAIINQSDGNVNITGRYDSEAAALAAHRDIQNRYHISGITR